MKDGIYIETPNGPQRIDLTDDARTANIAREQSLFTQQELQQATQQAQQIAAQQQIAARVARHLKNHPELQPHADIFAQELLREDVDFVEDPNFTRAISRASARTLEGISRVEAAEFKTRSSKNQAGLALGNDGRLYEGQPMTNIHVEETPRSGNTWLDGEREKRANLKRTFSNTGEA
jgi:multidrug efflux pump subunit AcrA (membrane-fusion protein)